MQYDPSAPTSDIKEGQAPVKTEHISNIDVLTQTARVQEFGKTRDEDGGAKMFS